MLGEYVADMAHNRISHCPQERRAAHAGSHLRRKHTFYLPSTLEIPLGDVSAEESRGSDSVEEVEILVSDPNMEESELMSENIKQEAIHLNNNYRYTTLRNKIIIHIENRVYL